MGEEKVALGEMDEDELIGRALEALHRKHERLKAEMAVAKETIHRELELVTIDEFRSLNHYDGLSIGVTWAEPWSQHAKYHESGSWKSQKCSTIDSRPQPAASMIYQVLA